MTAVATRRARRRPSMPATAPRGTQEYQVHEHCYIRGPRASNTATYKFSHSHEGGDIAHEHDGTGPAAYTIDRDAWRRATGLRGGGRKKFTRTPTGERLATIPLGPERLTYDLIVVPPSGAVAGHGVGPGIAPIVRLKLAHQMTPRTRARGDR